MFEYKTYLEGRNTISLEESAEIYTKLILQLDFNDTDTKELWDSFLKNGIKYAASSNNKISIFCIIITPGFIRKFFGCRKISLPQRRFNEAGDIFSPRYKGIPVFL